MGRTLLAVITLTGAFLAAVTGSAFAQCRAESLERFLENRAFELSAEDKIGLYADRLVRYYDKYDVSRSEVLNSMRTWERRWPERIYKYLAIIEFRKTEAGDACKVQFAYRFLAYDPKRDKVSAGLGTSTLVLADATGDGRFQIIGEIGEVKCRGLNKFARSRC